VKKRKKNLTRKGRILRLCAGFAAIIALASTLKLYHFLPIQAIHAMADQQDIEEPRVIDTFYDGTLPITRFALCHLVQGKDALMLCTTGYNPFMGWYDRTWSVVETWNGTGLYAGVQRHQQDDKQVTYFYGRVDAEAVETLSLEVDFTSWDGKQELKHHAKYTLAAEDFFEKDGFLYFCEKLPMEDKPLWEWLAKPRVVCTTADGTVLETDEVDWRGWSS